MKDPYDCKTVEGLIASIKMANNGYLLLDYMHQAEKLFSHECAKSGIVVITSGTVHMPATKPEFFKTPFPTKAFALRHDSDYEGAILDRQEAQGFYD